MKEMEKERMEKKLGRLGSFKWRELLMATLALTMGTATSGFVYVVAMTSSLSRDWKTGIAWGGGAIAFLLGVLMASYIINQMVALDAQRNLTSWAENGLVIGAHNALLSAKFLWTADPRTVRSLDFREQRLALIRAAARMLLRAGDKAHGLPAFDTEMCRDVIAGLLRDGYFYLDDPQDRLVLSLLQGSMQEEKCRIIDPADGEESK